MKKIIKRNVDEILSKIYPQLQNKINMLAKKLSKQKNKFDLNLFALQIYEEIKNSSQSIREKKSSTTQKTQAAPKSSRKMKKITTERSLSRKK